MGKAEFVFEKLAKILTVEDLENTLGFYLADKQEQKARKLLDKEYENRFALRHPWLTGIPTLGIAPAIASSKASDKVIRTLARSDKAFNKALELMKDKKRKEVLENYELQTKRIKAEQPSKAVAIGALGAMSLMDSYLKSKNETSKETK